MRESADIQITDLSQNAGKKPRRELIGVDFDPKLFGKMLADFAMALPNEHIVWLSGKMDEDGIAHVSQYWPCELEEVSPVFAKTSQSWLLGFRDQLEAKNPDHDVIIQAHIHPIGASLSGTDRQGLESLSCWSDDVCFCLLACSIPLGVYTVKEGKIVDVPWEVGIENWQQRLEQRAAEGRPSGQETPSTTLASRLARKIMELLTGRR